MTEFKSWDELSELEQLQTIFSDASKDAYGSRIRNVLDENWNNVEWLNAEIDHFSDIIRRNMISEQEREERSIAQVEEAIEKIIASGAKTRETAIRWFLNGETDMDYVSYLYGIPYGYFKEAA